MSDDLLQRFANLEPQKRALLLQKLQQQRGTAVKPPETAVPPLLHPRPEHLPLSYAQQRLWFLYQLEAGNAAYHLFMAVHLSGQLNVELFVQSVYDLGQRHEILRTTFPAKDGQPIQVIHSQFSLSMSLIDLSHLPPDQQHKTVHQQAQAEAKDRKSVV